MAQATPMSWRNAKIEYSTDGTTYTTVSGFSNKLTLDGGERATGEANTGEVDSVLLTKGKLASYKITLTAVYTEGATDLVTKARAAYTTPSDFYIRWSPNGGASGDKQFTTSAGIVTKPCLPQGDYGSPDPILIEFDLVFATYTEATVV